MGFHNSEKISARVTCMLGSVSPATVIFCLRSSMVLSSRAKNSISEMTNGWV